ncbi:MAG: stage III sporulation protein AA [Hungatella sp.]|nr:stage III sporulation protein AA [Hungatella sp.]
MEKKDQIIRIFARGIREIIRRVEVDFEEVQEIRLRAGGPLLMVYRGKEYYVTGGGSLGNHGGEAYIVTRDELRETMEYISNYSLYAFEEELRQGFITIQGGHRIGVAGRTVVEDQRVRSMKYISFINVRLSHQVRGCGDVVMPYIYEKNQVQHTLIVSPPRCGKTTLLRDMIRQLSTGGRGQKGVTVGVVDERSELGACYQGVPQNDLGVRTDILDCCPKAKGMMMLIRTMSPQVIAVDEIGSREDLEAVEYVMNCGCKLVATVHGGSVEDMRQKPILGDMVRGRMFERYIILNNRGQLGRVEEIVDGRGRRLYCPEGGACGT